MGKKLGKKTCQVFENPQGRVLKTVHVILNLKLNRYQEIGQKVEIIMDEKIVKLIKICQHDTLKGDYCIF